MDNEEKAVRTERLVVLTAGLLSFANPFDGTLGPEQIKLAVNAARAVLLEIEAE